MNRLNWLLGLALITGTVQAENWANWRGPTGNGVAPAGEFPTHWSASENIRWKVSLPGRGASTPIVWENQIFLTYGKDGNNVLACLDRDGQTQWEVALGKERSGKNKKASGSNPSAITDGKHVYAYFKSGDLACLDLQGNVVWRTNLQEKYGEDTLWWDLGTSPVLTKQCVVIAVMQSGPSYLVAFDKVDGQVVWKQDRMLDAPSEAAQSYSTPVVVSAGEQEILYVLGADHITAHEGATGKEIWRVGGLNPGRNGFFRSIASPVIAGDILIAPYARAETLTAVRLGGSGDVTKTHVAWFRDDLGTDVPTPAVLNGRVYVCTDKGTVACLRSDHGKSIWQEQVEKHRIAFSASPIIAGGHLYITREDGKTFVLKTGDKYELVAMNELPGEYVVATPVFVDGKILIRSFDSLYCVGK